MIKILKQETYNKLIERNKELEMQNIQFEGDYNLLKQFEAIGDEKLKQAYEKIDKYILQIKQLKEKYGKK